MSADTDILRMILLEIGNIRDQLGQSSDVRSSCEIKTSTRGVDISVKVYAGSPIEPACDQAMDEFMRVNQEITDRLMNKAQAA